MNFEGALHNLSVSRRLPLLENEILLLFCYLEIYVCNFEKHFFFNYTFGLKKLKYHISSCTIFL